MLTSFFGMVNVSWPLMSPLEYTQLPSASLMSMRATVPDVLVSVTVPLGYQRVTPLPSQVLTWMVPGPELVTLMA